MNFPQSTHQALLEKFNPSTTEVREIFKEIRHVSGADPTNPESHKIILSNGLSIGEFCLWYITSNRTLCYGGTMKNHPKK